MTTQTPKPTMSRGAVSGGFTLIEVLVVVAIIAVLVGILLPSLAKAREQARRSACTSNVHQLALAMTLYSNDNKGRMPWRSGDLAAWYWTVWVNNTDGHVKNRPEVPRGFKGELTRYIVSQKLLECPADDGDKVFSADAAWRKHMYTAWGTSYIYNGRDNLTTYQTVPGSIPRANASSFDRASDLVLCGDSTMHSHGRQTVYPYYQGSRFLWHDKRQPRAVLGFADGHAGYHRIDPDAPKEKVTVVSTSSVTDRLALRGKGFTFLNNSTDAAKYPGYKPNPD